MTRALADLRAALGTARAALQRYDYSGTLPAPEARLMSDLQGALGDTLRHASALAQSLVELEGRVEKEKEERDGA